MIAQVAHSSILFEYTCAAAGDVRKPVKQYISVTQRYLGFHARILLVTIHNISVHAACHHRYKISEVPRISVVYFVGSHTTTLLDHAFQLPIS